MIGTNDGETSNSKKDKNEDLKPIIARNATDVQRIRLEKLMKNPEKPVVLPEKPKEKSTPHVPEFVRNVMGSSAGAGSGEFHVYRHLRRKEYARQKCIQEKAEKELLEEEYHRKLEENRRKAEERTARKRAKRLKKKKHKGKRKKTDGNLKDSSESGSEEDESSTEHVDETEEQRRHSDEEPKKQEKQKDEPEDKLDNEVN
ncbi:PRKR-interacting protein 1 homolog [Anabrus simplex]|uniref:PRKR-interacting protein 1 homolog n=1 Tax=Anabrus simplex TaxID=316456 RepID=UPI0035A2B63F